MVLVDSVFGKTGGWIVVIFETGVGCAWATVAVGVALVWAATCVGVALVACGGRVGGVGEIVSSSEGQVNRRITQIVTTMMAVRSMKRN